MNGVPSVNNGSTVAATAPGAPTGLSATASGSTQINLSWTAPADNGGRVITGYKIESSSDGGSNWSDLVANTSSTTTTYAHTGLAGATTRHYRVSAINTIGTGLPSNIDNATTTNNAPTVANAIPDQSAPVGTAFSYAFPANTFSDADSDALTYTATKADGTALPTWLSFTASTRAFSGTPQAADTGTVSVKVTASDGNGGSVSDEFDITVSAAANTAPGAPTSLLATPSGTTQINLSWTAPGSTGGSAINGYKIEVLLRRRHHHLDRPRRRPPAAPPPPTRTPGLPPAPRATTASRPSTRSAPASPRTSPTPPPAPPVRRRSRSGPPFTRPWRAAARRRSRWS